MNEYEGLDCPKCGSETHVRDSRPHAFGIKRRRVCSKCGRGYSTIETPYWEDRRREGFIAPPWAQH